jgi:predicted DNA-binding transcriptional regulator AlpA
MAGQQTTLARSLWRSRKGELMPDQPSDRLLNSKQVADRLCISLRTLWRQLSTGDIPKPALHRKRTVRWRSSDIQAYIANLRNN